MWRVLGTFAGALQCVVINFDRWLGGRLWLGSHGDLLAAKEIAALLKAPTLQHFNLVRIFKGVCHLLVPFSPTEENQTCENFF